MKKSLAQIKEAADLIVEALNESGVGCYIWHIATTGSIYIRFEDNRIGSVRIGNHQGRSKLKYKYNLRTDLGLNGVKWIKDDNVWRCYIPLLKWDELVKILIDRSEQVKSWPQSKFQYTIPSFKKQKK